jgi:hypothetical protein
MKRFCQTRFWTARILVIACLMSCAVPLAAKQADPAVPNSEIRGRVVGGDGKPASDVEVFAYHLATEEVFTTRTNTKGRFAFTGLPYGYFDLATRTITGVYVSDQVANVGPAGKNVVEFRLQVFADSSRADQRSFPGLDDVPVGVARVVNQRMVGESFWRSPKGISVIAGAGGLVLLAIAGGSESDASPFVP